MTYLPSKQELDSLTSLLPYATEQEVALASRLLEGLEATETATAAENDLLEFTRQAWPIIEPETEFVSGRHIEAICEHLTAVADDQIRDLIITVPPKHTKSTLVSVMFFCWVWTRHPSTRWIFASYDAGLSVRDSVRCRDIIESPWYRKNWPHVRLKRDQNLKTQFENTRTGVRLATSVGGRSTGLGASLLICDDPINLKHAESVTYRQSVIDWWDRVMATRADDPKTAKRVVIMQRSHESDLAGHLISKARGYDLLCLPAEYEPDHPTPSHTKLGFKDWRTEPGELLCPDRFGPDEIATIKRDLGSYAVAGQLQQRPAPAKGGIFQRAHFLYYRVEDVDGRPLLVLTDRDGEQGRVWADECYWFQTCDTAMKTGEQNAWTVVATFLQTPNPPRLLVHDVYRARIPVPRQYAMLVAQRQKHPLLQFQAVEDHASGIGLIQEGRARGTPFQVLKAEGDKVSRCTAVCIQYENGMVYHRAGAEWLDKWEHELLSFPTGEFADQVDVCAYSGLIVQRRQAAARGVTLSAWPRRDEDRGKHAEEPEAALEGKRRPSLAQQLAAGRPKRDRDEDGGPDPWQL